MDRLTYPRKFLLISVLFGIPLALATYFLFGEINDSLGVGIAQGYATIGAIGFEGRWDYGAIGTVTNLAARLCGEAKGADPGLPPRGRLRGNPRRRRARRRADAEGIRP